MKIIVSDLVPSQLSGEQHVVGDRLFEVTHPRALRVSGFNFGPSAESVG